MMRGGSWLWCGAVLVGCLLAAEPCRAEWTFPSLNPFEWGSGQKKQPTTTLGRPSFENSTQRRGAPAQQTTWDKVSGGTKTFFTKSKETLMPWTKPAPTTRTSPTGTRKVHNAPPKRTSENNSWLPNWFGSKEPERRQPPTPSEWLALPRP